MYHNLLFKSKLKYTKEAQVSNIRLRRFENKSIVWFKKPSLTTGGRPANIPHIRNEEDSKEFDSQSMLFLFTFVHSLKSILPKNNQKCFFSMFILPL